MFFWWARQWKTMKDHYLAYSLLVRYDRLRTWNIQMWFIWYIKISHDMTVWVSAIRTRHIFANKSAAVRLSHGLSRGRHARGSGRFAGRPGRFWSFGQHLGESHGHKRLARQVAFWCILNLLVFLSHWVFGQKKCVCLLWWRNAQLRYRFSSQQNRVAWVGFGMK